MAAKKVGALIKEARTEAKLTQAELASKVDDCTANDISKVERGEKDLSTAQLKQIAKALGVTQKSLIEAPSNTGKTSSSKNDSKSDSGKSSSDNKTSIKVSAAEKKLIEAYRKADSEAKKNALKILKGEEIESDAGNVISFITDAIGALGKKK